MGVWTRRVAELVGQEAGLDLSRCRAASVRGVLQGLALEWGLSGPEAVLDAARGSNRAVIIERLLSALLVHETFFYRYRSQLEAIERDLLAQLHASQPRTLRLWSAGCSSGPEAYTLAMISARARERAGSQANVEVLGTDLSADALDIARRGHYPWSCADELPADLRERFLENAADNEVCITRSLSELVRFERHNLRDFPPSGRFHVVCCRNVLMYLQDESARVAVRHLVGALEPGGVLAVGHGESLRAYGDLVVPERATSVNLYRAKSVDRPPPGSDFVARRATKASKVDRVARAVQPSSRPTQPTRIVLSGVYDVRDSPDSLERLRASLAEALSGDGWVEIMADSADSLDQATARLIARASRSMSGRVVVVASRPAARRWAVRYGLPIRSTEPHGL